MRHTVRLGMISSKCLAASSESSCPRQCGARARRRTWRTRCAAQGRPRAPVPSGGARAWFSWLRTRPHGTLSIDHDIRSAGRAPRSARSAGSRPASSSITSACEKLVVRSNCASVGLISTARCRPRPASLRCISAVKGPCRAEFHHDRVSVAPGSRWRFGSRQPSRTGGDRADLSRRAQPLPEEDRAVAVGETGGKPRLR